MADNISLKNDDATVVGTLASDDIGGIQYARSKITLGADGINDGDVSGANPLPVKGTGTAGTPNAGVVTVQGIASMTALVVDGSAVTQPVSGTVTANAGTGTFTVDTELPSAAALADAAGNPTTPLVGSCILMFNGTTWDRIRGDTTNGLDVDVTRLPSLPAGDNNIGNVDVVTMPTVTVTATDLDIRDLTSASDSVAAVQSGAWSVSIGAALPAGTNNIGDVDVLTQPARAATTDTITAKLATDAIQDGTTALTPKFASIDVATSGDNTIVAAVASKKIRVLAYTLVCAAATTVIWKSATAGAITGDMSFAANGGIAAPFSPIGHFETTAGEALVLNLSAANAVSGHLVYVEA